MEQALHEQQSSKAQQDLLKELESSSQEPSDRIQSALTAFSRMDPEGSGRISKDYFQEVLKGNTETFLDQWNGQELNLLKAAEDIVQHGDILAVDVIASDMQQRSKCGENSGLDRL